MEKQIMRRDRFDEILSNLKAILMNYDNKHYSTKRLLFLDNSTFFNYLYYDVQ